MQTILQIAFWQTSNNREKEIFFFARLKCKTFYREIMQISNDIVVVQEEDDFWFAYLSRKVQILYDSTICMRVSSSIKCLM